MFAVIKTGGKQYRVAANDEIRVEYLAGEAGDIVEIGHVLMVGAGAEVSMGAPFVAGALVTAEVVEQGRSKKTLSFKKRRRQNSKRIKGHRQLLTTLRISEILTDGAKPSKKAKKAEPKKAETEAVSAAPAEAPVAEKKAAKPKPAKAKAEETEAMAPLMAVGEVAAAPAEKAAKPRKAKAKAEIADDLSLISGVGPVLKGKLEAAGITSLKQIAQMSEAALAKLDDDLDLGGRSDTEEWIAQAKELLAGKPPRARTDKEAAKSKK